MNYLNAPRRDEGIEQDDFCGFCGGPIGANLNCSICLRNREQAIRDCEAAFNHIRESLIGDPNHSSKYWSKCKCRWNTSND